MKHLDLINKILNERRELEEIEELSTDTLKQYVSKGSKRISDIKAKGFRKSSAEAGEMLHLDKNVAKAVAKVRAKTPDTKSEPTKVVHNKVALHSQLKDLKGQFDPSYQHSDDHSVYTKHRDIHAKITDIEKKLRESEIDELSKATIGSYVKKAALDLGSRGVTAGIHAAQGKLDPKVGDKYVSRIKGINKGTDRLTKESEELDELSTSTLDSYADKAKKSSSALMNKAGRSKNLTRAMELLNKSGKRQDGATKAAAKSSFKKAGQRWGVTESELEEAIVVHSSKEKDGKEYQVLSRKNNREFVIQSKKKDGTWHTHDAVGNAQRARQLITTGRYSLNEADKVQVVSITLPALIRLCEIAREDIDEDTDLHEFIEAVLNKASGTIDSQTLEDIEGDGDSDEDNIKEGEIVSADRKVGKDGRLYPRSKKTLGKETNSLTGAKI